MKTGELRTWTVVASFPSVMIFSPSLSQRDESARRKKEKKRSIEGRLVPKLSSKELLFESWQQASRQMVFEKRDEERTVG